MVGNQPCVSGLSQCLELIRSDGRHTDTDAEFKGM